jgi:hypothetical protein
MMMKYLAVGITAITFFCLVSAGRAETGMLSLDCGINGSVNTNVWVDIGKSTVTMGYPLETPPHADTFPAQITVTSISWNQASGAASWSIDRVSGVLTTTVTMAGVTIYPQQCVRGTTPLPVTKF